MQTSFIFVEHLTNYWLRRLLRRSYMQFHVKHILRSLAAFLNWRCSLLLQLINKTYFIFTFVPSICQYKQFAFGIKNTFFT